MSLQEPQEQFEGTTEEPMDEMQDSSAEELQGKQTDYQNHLPQYGNVQACHHPEAKHESPDK